MGDNSALTPALQRKKESAIELLSRHYTSDHIELEDFEARLDQLYRARSLAEIEAAQQGLPELNEPSATVELSDEAPRHSKLVAAVMGGTEKKGAWRPARRITALALMGGVELDFREARFAPGTTVLTAIALMGGIEIIVPPGLRVESDGIGIMGGFEGLSLDAEQGATAGPVLRIEGLALFGGVEITQRLSRESAKEAGLRLKAARRQD